MTREIRDIDSTNEAVAHRVIATAFAQDPVIRWGNADPQRDQAIFRAISLALHGSGQGEYLLYEDGVAVGAAHWDPPSWEPPAAQKMRAIPILLGATRLRVLRGVALARAAAAVRPKHPHWYLATIGAAIPGKGIGSELLKHQIDQIEGPAYLESSNIQNNPLYERFGFKVVHEIKPTPSGPTLWAMYRD